MITFITGKPGDGKSLYGTALLLDVLVKGEAYVVTNIPLVPAEVAAYVAKERKRRKDDTPFNFDDSCRVLADHEVYEFYRRRSGGLVLNASPDFECEPRDRLDRPQFVEKMKAEFMKIKAAGEACMRPVWYFIDEAHNFFSAREWASAGRGMLYYTSQHRHLHDQIFFITQVVDNVEKQLRGLASELHRVRNQLRRSVGPFKMRPCFKIHHFYGVPSDNTPTQPFNLTTLFLDPAGVAGCYRTVGALGVQSKPEKIVNAGKLPWWSMWVAGAALVCLIAGTFVLLPTIAGKASSKMLLSAVNSATAEEYLPGAAKAAAGHTQRAAGVATPEATAPARLADNPNPDRLGVTGVVYTGKKISVYLSDGSVRTEDDGSLLHVNRSSVDLRDLGRVYFRRGAGASPDSAPRVERSRNTSPPASNNQVAPGHGTTSSGQQPASQQGSWIVGSDGVSRLREIPQLGL